MGRIGNELCPVAAILAYVAIRGQEEGPFFLLSTRKPLSRRFSVKMLKEDLDRSRHGLFQVLRSFISYLSSHHCKVGCMCIYYLSYLTYMMRM